MLWIPIQSDILLQKQFLVELLFISVSIIYIVPEPHFTPLHNSIVFFDLLVLHAVFL